MQRTFTTHAREHIGQRIQVEGWLQSRRGLGGLTFLTVRDGWGSLQIVSEGDEATAALDAAGAQLESIVSVEGAVAESEQAPGGIELREPYLQVLVPVTEPSPVPLGKRELKASLPTVLDHAAVTSRHPARRAVLRLGSALMEGFRDALRGQGFTEISTPKIVASATESGANVFKLGYFGRPAYLAQSPQFYKQMMVGVFERVFEVGPVFRAEPHDTTRHINEYVSLDAEFGFIENHFDVMGVLRTVVKGMLDTVRTECEREVDLLGIQVPEVPETIPHLHFAEAQALILRLHGVDERGEPDLSPQDERWLGEWAQQEHGSDFLFVTGYPMRARPFYTHPDRERPEFSNSFDLLYRGAEMTTGGQRLHRYQDYLDALAAADLPVAPFEAYLEAFRYGMPPHGGFAIGLERVIMQMTGVPSIKLATLFPRDIHRVTP